MMMANDHWRSMSREEFEREHARGFANGGMLWPWCQLTWKERVMRVVLVYPAMAAAVIGGFIAMLAVFGIIIEGVGQYSEQLDRCKRHAATPHEYHQCK